MMPQSSPILTAAQRLESLLNRVPEQVSAIPEAQFRQALAPGKWSRAQHLGHLLDSARYNLDRFLRAQTDGSPYPVQSYPQDALVAVQSFSHMPRDLMLRLWLDVNFHILWVLSALPAGAEKNAILKPDGEPASLGWLVADYVDHLEHHLRSILKTA